MTCTIINLPMPPSGNALYRNARKGRVKTWRYMEWLDAAGWKLKSQEYANVTGPVELSIILPRPLTKSGKVNMRRQDASNRIKALEDFLVQNAVIEDDTHTVVYAVSARWDDGGGIPQGMCQIKIFPVPERIRGTV